MKTTTARKLDALAAAFTVMPSFALLIGFLSQRPAWVPTISNRQLAQAIKQAGYQVWNPATGRNW
jgi:hypothetical protein